MEACPVSLVDHLQSTLCTERVSESAPMCGVEGHALGAGQVGVGAQAVALLAAGTSVASAPPHARLHCRQRIASQLHWRRQLYKCCDPSCLIAVTSASCSVVACATHCPC